MGEPVGVVARVGRILRALSATPTSGATTTEVARASSLPRATTHRLLEGLMDEGLVDRDQTSGRWFCGPELYVLGVAAAHRYDLTARARPIVEKLAETTGESAFFSVLRGTETVVLLRTDGHFPIRSHVLYEGLRLPLGVASAGLVTLAHLPDDVITDYLSHADLAATWGTSHSDTLVWERVREARRMGWSLNPGLIVEGSWGMAAAVFDESGRPIGALTLTGIEARFGADRRSELGTALLSEAHRLTMAAIGGDRNGDNLPSRRATPHR